jgi:hypothetical protein
MKVGLLLITTLITELCSRSSFDYQMQKKIEAEESLKQYVSLGVCVCAVVMQ